MSLVIPTCRVVSRWRTALLSLALVLGAAHHDLLAQSAASATISPATRALRPGDGLRVRIFREPDLSGDFLVDERGIVVLPKLGEWNAAGVSADSVRPQLVAAYHKYLTTDAIEITPYRRVAVTGAVLKPGLYPIDASMTVGDAIMLAGGVSPSGKRDVVELRQANEPSGVRITSERRLWESGAGGIRQLYVPQEGWMKRNVLTVVSVSLSVLTATTLLIRR